MLLIIQISGNYFFSIHHAFHSVIIQVNTLHATIGFTINTTSFSKFSKVNKFVNQYHVSRYVCTYLNAFLMLIQNIDSKFQNVDIFENISDIFYCRLLTTVAWKGLNTVMRGYLEPIWSNVNVDILHFPLTKKKKAGIETNILWLTFIMGKTTILLTMVAWLKIQNVEMHNYQLDKNR